MLTKSESNETRIDVENRSTRIPNSRQSSSVNSRLLLRSKECTFLDESDSIAAFDAPVLNTGNALNTASGVFTAPRAGIYSFSFWGMDLNTFFQQLSKLKLPLE